MSEREWKPGDVAMVNNRYDAGDWRRATCVSGGPTGEARWTFSDGASVWGSVSEARPLVVIDPEDAEQIRRLAEIAFGGVGKSLDRDAANMQAALREFADPKPPKPDEPQGLGAVVRDIEGILWTRVESGEPEARNPWYPADSDFQPDEWANLGVRSDDDVLSQGYEVQS